MQNTIGPTCRLGRYTARIAGAELSGDCMRKAAFCLLDAFGLAIGASEEPTFQAFLKTTSTTAAGAGYGRIWSGGSWHALSEAVEANAILAHAHFHDDSEYSSWSHPA